MRLSLDSPPLFICAAIAAAQDVSIVNAAPIVAHRTTKKAGRRAVDRCGMRSDRLASLALACPGEQASGTWITDL